MAAMQKFAGSQSDPRAGNMMLMPMHDSLQGHVAIPYAFPKAGAYRLFVQIKRDGKVQTAAFDVDVRP